VDFGACAIALQGGEPPDQFGHLAKKQVGCHSHAPVQGGKWHIGVRPENRYAAIRVGNQFGARFQPQSV